MNINIIKNLIKNKTTPSRWLRAIKYNDRKLVEYVTFNIDNNILTFDGMVESDFFNEIYPNSISIDILNNKIINTNCTCEDFRSRNMPKNIFICKHIAATSIAGFNSIDEEVLNSALSSTSKSEPKITPLTPTQSLLHLFNDSEKEEINLEANITIFEDKICVDFKIGLDKMYVMKNLEEFVDAKSNNKLLEYGKNFIYNPSTHYFSDVDSQIVDIIEEYVSLKSSNFNNTYPFAKYMYVGFSGFRRLLKDFKNKEFTLIYGDKTYSPKIIQDKLPIKFNLEKSEDDLVLSSNDNLPISFTPKGDVLLFDESIYLLSNENAIYYSNILKALENKNEIKFNKNESDKVLSNLMPKIKSFSKKININQEIKDNIIDDFSPKFYFDLKNSNIVCELKFIYDDTGSKYVVRNLEKEKIYKDKLKSLNFKKDKDLYVFKGDDSDLFNFLDIEIMQLKDLGDVYYSDKFKQRKIIKSTSILASIKDTLDGYLDFSFNISDIDKKDFKNIILEFKKKSKFYKLKDGNFLDLQEKNTQDFLELVDNLDLVNLSENKIPMNKLFYINDILNSKNLNFIKGKDELDTVCDKFRNIETLDFTIPKHLNAKLRDYQISGLNFFKTLDYYGFGGILADEMGLGKTLQTISFLASKKEENKNIKSLIVSPTSLLYNWKSEFDKFYPDLNVLLIHGNKKDRAILLKDIEGYDVIVTTYSTLRNDIDLYNSIKFDYFIIDEAQNIKNPISQTTVSVKSIDAKSKFALTGTPIENNLLELWSIFDFVMPGYLYNKNKFQDLFIYDEYNSENLKKLIKPFILRRTKKEVMKELPDKIETKFLVELNKEQRKIYTTYVTELKEKINNKNVKTDKITLFSYLTKLRQLCLDPSVLIDGYNKKSSKIETALELIKDYLEDNHKILLFSQFTSVLKNIGTTLSQNNISYSYIDGQIDAKSRLKLVNDFNENDDTKVFLISLKAGGTGLNLTSADVVIHFDPWWNPSVENQASDRAHRYGQENVVQVIKLIAKGTIEEKIVTLQENKIELTEKFINGDLSDSNILRNLSENDIIDLFN